MAQLFRKEGSDMPIADGILEGPFGPQGDLNGLLPVRWRIVEIVEGTCTIRNQTSGSAHPGLYRILLHPGTRTGLELTA